MKPQPQKLDIRNDIPYAKSFRGEVANALNKMAPLTHSFKVRKNQVAACWKVARKLGFNLGSRRIVGTYPLEYRIWRKS